MISDDGTRTRTPLDVLRRAAADRTPLAPVHAAVHAELVEIEPGRCRGRLPQPAGPHGPGGADGTLAAVLVLADFVVGLAVTGTLAAGRRITTVRLGVQALADPAPGADLRGTGRLDHLGGGVGVSSAEIVDTAGTPVARCTGRNAVLTDAIGDSFADTPPAWAPAPRPLARLLPDEVTASRADGLELVAHPDPDTANSADVVQGGVLGAVAARGLGLALGRRVDELALTFLRAVPADGRPVTCRVTAEHAGRSLRSGRAELRDARDRLVLTASGLAYAPTGAAAGRPRA